MAPFMCLLFVICSCRTVKYIPVETIKVDTTYINKLQRDSIYMLDSVYVKEKGDTVLIEKYKYLYRDKLVRDTMYISKVDSIQVPYPVEKELTRWQQFRMDFGGWAMCIVVISILILIVYKIKK
ncbi:hypothetical protein DWY20_13925 [Phocaeicola coprocola]|uniref:Uncharacterized protein n=1 Tax=Phocaeicola coprocola TaxID=310298 RepID=A0A412G884_9BACT|nr:hypothetical protein DWY20_13925 [Phocaeicola coprocola]